MRKEILFAVTFAVLFFVAISVYAKTDNNEGVGIRNAILSKWKSLSINSENLPSAMPTKAKIYQLFFAGAGIAVNPDDKLDFKYIRIIGGRVLVPANNVSEESSNSADLERKCINTTAGKERCFTFVRAGLIYLDKERYTLRKIDFDNDSATAGIYQNGTEVGSITLVKVVKMDKKMWVGTLTINNTNYYAYIIGADHPLLIAEKVEEKAETKWQENKACGPKLPSVNVTEIVNCRKNGGRIYVGRDENGCPMAPICASTNCTPITPLSAQDRTACRSEGGNVVAGVDDDGCPLSPKCLLPSGETG
jgi:hypothetical protein